MMQVMKVSLALLSDPGLHHWVHPGIQPGLRCTTCKRIPSWMSSGNVTRCTWCGSKGGKQAEKICLTKSLPMAAAMSAVAPTVAQPPNKISNLMWLKGVRIMR